MDLIIIFVIFGGEIFIQDMFILIDEVVFKFEVIVVNGYEEWIYVCGDQDVDYGIMMQLMGCINVVGFKWFGFVILEEWDL